MAINTKSAPAETQRLISFCLPPPCHLSRRPPPEPAPFPCYKHCVSPVFYCPASSDSLFCTHLVRRLGPALRHPLSWCKACVCVLDLAPTHIAQTTRPRNLFALQTIATTCRSSIHRSTSLVSCPSFSRFRRPTLHCCRLKPFHPASSNPSPHLFLYNTSALPFPPQRRPLPFSPCYMPFGESSAPWGRIVHLLLVSSLPVGLDAVVRSPLLTSHICLRQRVTARASLPKVRSIGKSVAVEHLLAVPGALSPQYSPSGFSAPLSPVVRLAIRHHSLSVWGVVCRLHLHNLRPSTGQLGFLHSFAPPTPHIHTYHTAQPSPHGFSQQRS